MKNISIIVILVELSLFHNCYSQYTENYAGHFNGINSYVAVQNYGELTPPSAITLEAWINPSTISASGMAVIGKNFQSSYYLGVHPTGRVEFCPKGGGIFVSKVETVIAAGVWTHIAGTYDGSITSIYINGELDTSTTVITGAIGVNNDSLFIGADRVGNTPALFFNGKIDNVRIWGLAKYAGFVSDQRFEPFEIFRPTGVYGNLRASFQLDADAASYSGFSWMVGTPRNLSFVDYRDKAVNHMDYNGSLVLNGLTDHFTILNQSGFNATTAITLEAWIRRDTIGSQPAIQNIVNKSGPPDRCNYALGLNSADGCLRFSINSPGGPPTYISPQLITDAQWHHVAVTYNSATGYVIVYLNGFYVASTILIGHPLIENTLDNIYIGGIGIPLLEGHRFKGQIDGVRIWKYERSPNEIRNNVYRSLNNVPQLTHFDFDKFTNAVYSDGLKTFTTNVFAGLAHVSSSHQNNEIELTSPLLSGKPGVLDTNFTKNNKSFFIPDGSPVGITDSFLVSGNSIITNLKAYVLLSHTYIGDMYIRLTSPSGTSVVLFQSQGGRGNDLMTIFSDAADSVASYGIYPEGQGITPPFSPSIKPDHPLSAFNGENQNGWWKMKFVDDIPPDRGYLHSWGISVKSISPKIIKLSALIQGFYNNVTDKMVRDTVRLFLRNATSPYNFIDSSKSVLDSLGKGIFALGPIPSSQSFYIVVKHRNSIETWSEVPFSFTTDVFDYDFTYDVHTAFGNNLMQVETSPAKFAIYNGDVNQDEAIDLTDVINIYNDATNFVTGYKATDVTGDNQIDLNDELIAYNNSVKFVRVVKP